MERSNRALAASRVPGEKASRGEEPSRKHGEGLYVAYSLRGARRGAGSRSECGQGFPNRTGKGALNQLGLDDPRKVTLVAGGGDAACGVRWAEVTR